MVPPISIGDVTRPCLGRSVSIGGLYDIRKEYLSCVSLFDTGSLGHLIKTKDLTVENYKYRFIENISDRFELLDIDTDTQASVISGLIDPQGSGAFLKNEKKSQKTVSCSLMIEFRTVHEKLFATLDEPSIDFSPLAYTFYTHVISDIIWGARCVVSVELECGPDCSKKNVQERLAEEIEIVLESFARRGKPRKSLPLLSSVNGFNGLKIYSDILPCNVVLVTIHNVIDFLRKVSDMLVEGNGVRPLYFGLTSLEEFRVFANLNSSIPTCWKNVEDVFIQSIIYLFKHIEVIKQKLCDLQALLNGGREEYKVRRFRQELTMKGTRLREIILSGLVLLKSGEEKLLDLFMLVEKYKNEELNLLSYSDYIDTCFNDFPSSPV